MVQKGWNDAENQSSSISILMPFHLISFLHHMTPPLSLFWGFKAHSHSASSLWVSLWSAPMCLIWYPGQSGGSLPHPGGIFTHGNEWSARDQAVLLMHARRFAGVMTTNMLLVRAVTWPIPTSGRRRKILFPRRYIGEMSVLNHLSSTTGAEKEAHLIFPFIFCVPNTGAEGSGEIEYPRG